MYNNNYNARVVPEFMAYGGTPVGIPTGAVPQNATSGAIPQWALGQQNQNQDQPQPTTQFAQNDTQMNDGNCYMTFNGQNLKLYNNGTLTNNLDAMSGQPDYQNRTAQNIPYKGPLPEGTYYANQDQRQTITPVQAGFGFIAPVLNTMLPKARGSWNGSLPAWGLRRVWLQPDVNTNTYGRSGFSIHGGWSKGSAGCIDIPWQTNKLNDFMDNCQDSVPIYVNYPKESW